MPSPPWLEYTVVYEVRRSRQDEATSGKKWARTETQPLEREDAIVYAASVNRDGRNIRNARVVRKECKVVG